jgi:hypothetical protein
MNSSTRQATAAEVCLDPTNAVSTPRRRQLTGSTASSATGARLLLPKTLEGAILASQRPGISPEFRHNGLVEAGTPSRGAGAAGGNIGDDIDTLQRAAGMPSLSRPFVLGHVGPLRGLRRGHPGAAARVDHSGGAAPADLGMPPRQPQHRGARRRGPRLGRYDHDRRNDSAAARYADRHRIGASARQARGGWRAGCDFLAGSLRTG